MKNKNLLKLKLKFKMFDLYSNMLDEYVKNPSEHLKQKIERVSSVL